MTVTVHQRCPLTVRIPRGRGEECVIYTMSVLYLGIRLHLKHQNPVAEKKVGCGLGERDPMTMRHVVSHRKCISKLVNQSEDYFLRGTPL